MPIPDATVLALHHGYRVAGGEEASAEALARLAEAQLGERVAWLRRDSSELGAAAAARGLLAGGSGPREVRDAMAASGADLLHAHNLFPTFGPKALRAARDAGAAIVVHLHNYRLVCAVATNVREGRDCTECRVGQPTPGVRHRCRGSIPEAVAYATALPRWQRSVADLADAIIVPSVAARTRLHELGLALPAHRVHVVGGVAERVATESHASRGRYALAVTRLAPEKDLRTAIDACAAARLPLVIAGTGPERDELLAHAGSADGSGPVALSPAGTMDAWTRDVLGAEVIEALGGRPVRRGTTIFVGQVDASALNVLRGGARIGLATSVAHETFGLSALESMAAALPTVGSAVGALPELLGADAVVPPGDVDLLAERIAALAGRDDAGLRAAQRAAELASPERVSASLGATYAAAREAAAARHAYRR